MSRRISGGSAGLWVPLLVVAIGWAFSGGAWYALVSERREQLVAGAQEVARHSEIALSEELQSERAALRGLADLWPRFGERARPEWRAAVEPLIASRNGLEAVAWVDLDDPARRLALGRDGRAADLDLDLERVRAFHPEPGVLGPLEREDGSAYRVYLPIESADGAARGLVADVRLNELLTPLFRGRAPGYAITAFWEGEPVFARGLASERADHSWWRAEGAVELPEGDTWRILHRPTSELAAERLPPVPDYLLAMGLLLSTLLGAFVHQWRVMSGQTRALEGTNRSLEERHRDLEALNDELERRVAERTEQLEDAISELEAFNHSVSHDLRSPLGAVLNLVAILREDFSDRLDAEGLELIDRIERCASRATGLLEDLLELSQTGQAVLEIERIDTTTLAEEMFAQVRASTEEAGEEVEFVLQPLPDVHADRALLGTVFSNLFSNALKYSRGCPKRRVTVSGRVEANECVIEVADNGRGFDMRFAPRLFGLFERLHGEEIEGTGVGLAMVARIMKRHGGRAWGHGEVGVGARFSVALPRMGEDT